MAQSGCLAVKPPSALLQYRGLLQPVRCARPFGQAYLIKKERRGLHSTTSSLQAEQSPAQESAKEKVYPIPPTSAACAEQAANAAKAAWADGVRRQRVELQLPLIGATDIDDWPGGVRQQFKAVLPMVEQVLRELKATQGLEGPLRSSIWDQGDAVGAWLGERLAAIVFPTGETLDRVKLEAEQRGEGLVLLVNPQWQGGQVVSDFGFGHRKAQAEELVDSFRDVYVLKQYRILGEDVRLLYKYPGMWQLHVQDKKTRRFECIAVSETRLGYKEIEVLVGAMEGSITKLGWLERLKTEFKFNKDSLGL